MYSNYDVKNVTLFNLLFTYDNEFGVIYFVPLAVRKVQTAWIYHIYQKSTEIVGFHYLYYDAFLSFLQQKPWDDPVLKDASFVLTKRFLNIAAHDFWKIKDIMVVGILYCWHDIFSLFDSENIIRFQQVFEICRKIRHAHKRCSPDFVVFVVNLLQDWFLWDSPPAPKDLLENSEDIYGRCTVEVSKPNFQLLQKQSDKGVFFNFLVEFIWFYEYLTDIANFCSSQTIILIGNFYNFNQVVGKFFTACPKIAFL